MQENPPNSPNARAAWLLGGIFGAGICILMWEARALANTEQSWVLHLVALAIATALVSKLCRMCKAGFPDRAWLMGLMLLISIWGGVLGLAIRVNHAFPTKPTHRAEFEIVEKLRKYRPGGKNFQRDTWNFVLLIDGSSHKVEVSPADWERASVGEKYSIEITDGLLGLRVIGPTH